MGIVLSLLIVLTLMAVTVFWAMTYESSGLMLLAFIEAALFVISFLGLIIRRFTISGQLEIPVGISEQGNESRIKIAVTNKGLLSVARIKAKVVIRDDMRGTKEKHWFRLPVAARGDSIFIRDMQFSKIGNYNIILKKLRVYDMTGLLYVDIRKKSKGCRLCIMPKLREVSLYLTESTRKFYGESDEYDDTPKGADNSELLSVREYREGDRLQNVHWKLSAKQDDIMVKEHAMSHACPIVLFLEYNPRKRRVNYNTLIPYMEVAFNLSFSLMNAGCSHYVVWYDGNEKDIKRLRVDKEESLFFFIDMLMKVKWIRYEDDMLGRYQEKYRREPYAHALYLDSDLTLKKDDELLGRISGKKLENALDQIEILI